MQRYLTPKEIQITKLIADGLNNIQIGEILFISKHTVKNHINHCLRKFNLGCRSSLVTKAVRLGLIDLPGGENPVSTNLEYFSNEMKEGRVKFVTREMVFGTISK